MNQANRSAGPENNREIPAYQNGLMVLGNIYLHGFLAFLVVFVLVRVVRAILPAFEVIANPALRVTVAILSMLIVPPLLGTLIRFGVYPLVGRHHRLARFARWDERLFADLDQAKRRAQILMIDWPTQNVKTMGILTRSFVDQSTGEDMAAVYVPSISKAQLSYVHVCRLSDVTMTNWTLDQWQLFHLSLGAFGPESVETQSNRP